MRSGRQSLIQSFLSAFRGLRYALEGRSFIIQSIVGVGALVAVFVWQFDNFEKIIVVLLVGLVLTIETANTAVERLLDHITPHEHPDVARIKELMAGAVLIMSLAALVIGIMIFSGVL